MAGVSIAMLTGNNGILTQAKTAKENTQAAKEDEEKYLEQMNGVIQENTIKNNYIDINGDKATIPEGFSVDETENVISKGLVVHGPDKVNGDNGSEFVWIPVSDVNSMAQCSIAGENCNLQLENGVLKCKTHNDNEEIVGKLYAVNNEENFGTINTKYDENSGLREPAILTGSTDGHGDNNDNNVEYNNNLFTLKSLKADYKNMITSVAKYGGFYVGRYEISLSNADESSAGTTGLVQSKQGVIPTSAANETTSMWYGLYRIQNKTYTGTNNSVESSMIWGSQYDAMINWFKEGSTENQNKIVNVNLGNCNSNKVTTTGNMAYADDCINNIRDLGGNLREWTLEANDITTRVSRGGCYDSKHSPSFRYGYNTKYNYEQYSSRLALYIK